jgi:hypothetical protein
MPFVVAVGTGNKKGSKIDISTKIYPPRQKYKQKKNGLEE